MHSFRDFRKVITMELRLLKYFLEAANELNITRAAQRLHITQPSLSRQIADLEHEVGRKLFTRERFGIRLTEEGVLLKKRAQEIIGLEEKTLSELSGTNNENIIGTVYIGAGETIGIKHISRVLKKLRTDHNGIRYRMISGDSEDVSDKLEKGLVDFGLFIGRTGIHISSSYNYIALSDSDVWGVVVRSDDTLAGKTGVTPDDLKGRELLFSYQAKTQGEFSEWLGYSFDELDIIGTYNLAYNSSVMVREGLGILVTIDGIISTGGESGLKFIPLTPELKAGLVLAWKKSAVFSKAALKFLEYFKASLA